MSASTAARGVVLLALGTAGLAMACGGRAGPETRIPTNADGEMHDLTDCPWVAEGCVETDGCSERRGHATEAFPPGDALRVCGIPSGGAYAQLLADVASELRHEPSLQVVLVRGSNHDCLLGIRDAFVAAGIAPARIALEGVHGKHYPSFHVVRFAGRSCTPPP